jgi:hypothetical protein
MQDEPEKIELELDDAKSESSEEEEVEEAEEVEEYSIQFESNLLLQLVRMGCQTFNKTGI